MTESGFFFSWKGENFLEVTAVFDIPPERDGVDWRICAKTWVLGPLAVRYPRWCALEAD